MAVGVQVAGACQLRIAASDVNSGALTTLGYGRNLTEVTKEAFWMDVPGDENGGDDGPPIDVIYLGEIARIRMELTKWDDVVADALRRRIQNGTTGQPGTPGSLMFSGLNTMRLLLNAPNNPRNFTRCFPRSPIEIGRGTKYSSLIVEFEAHKDASGVLYNSVIN